MLRSMRNDAVLRHEGSNQLGRLFLDLVAESECSVLVGPGERNALEQKSNPEGARLAPFHTGLGGRSSSAFLPGPW